MVSSPTRTLGLARSPDVASVTIAGGVTLSYAALGDSEGTALVLLPGPTDSWRSYLPVLDRLGIERAVVAGHSGSCRSSAT